MAIDVKDQPKRAYMDYDVTDSGYDMADPYRRVSKPLGAGVYVMVVMCALIIITWLASTIAWWIA